MIKRVMNQICHIIFHFLFRFHLTLEKNNYPTTSKEDEKVTFFNFENCGITFFISPYSPNSLSFRDISQYMSWLCLLLYESFKVYSSNLFPYYMLFFRITIMRILSFIRWGNWEIQHNSNSILANNSDLSHPKYFTFN